MLKTGLTGDATLPMRRPWVILNDSREAQDIMARRTPRKFDGSEMAVDMFVVVMPKNESHMFTNDE